jgi:hypothetical protein
VLYVADRATFNVVDAAERGCAATVFNTLNGRGQELSAADNIKCDLLENSKLREEEASAAARKWEELEDSLGRVRFGKLLNMMPFLLTGEQFNSPGDLAAFRAQVERGGGVRTFLFDKLPRYAAALRDILDGAVDVGGADSEVRATINADINRRLAMMKLIEEWHWAPAALAFLAEHRKPQNAKRFFQALDAFSFACAISGEIINHKNREKRWIEAAKHADEIEHVLSPEVLGMKDDERTRLIARFNLAKPKDLMRRLMLVRIEAALPGGSMLTLDDILTVEHILPARGSNPYWLALFSDKAMRESTANMLGNLTLVTRKQNEEVDCKPFPEKLDVYFNTPGALIHALTRPLKELKEWTRDEIEGRQDDMIYSLLVDWGLAKKGG